ncbi:hypothetical protein [Paenibacillus sp. SYP-B3998]|nr:hypothetical protein [Paenibacillus sp. SYP-B3998]
MINLFGNNVDCILNVEDENLIITFSDENQKALKAYLKRVLQRYGHNSEAQQLSFQNLLEKGIEVEKNIGGNMSEPKIKLPYEFAPEVKEKLIEASAIQGLSATQLLIKLIESKYQSVINNH